MATRTTDVPQVESATVKIPGGDVPFGVNAMRLCARHWWIVAAIVLVSAVGVPQIWKRVERFDTGPDYRIPYSLSKDYWLYQRWLERTSGPAEIPVLGDSVVWGEYVRPTGTLTHFLSRETGQGEAGPAGRFINCGVNGLFPLAMEGLIEHYGSSLQNRKLIVHCNVLWMTSPRVDLSSQKEEVFNHARLVPQGYLAPAERRRLARVYFADSLLSGGCRRPSQCRPRAKRGLFRVGGPRRRRIFRPTEHPAVDTGGPAADAGGETKLSVALSQLLAQPVVRDHARRTRRKGRRSPAGPGQPAAHGVEREPR